MLEGRRFGYAVMNKTLTGYSLSSEDIETCKRYCHKGDVIVEQIPYVYGIQIRIRFYKPWKWIYYDRYANELNIGWMHIQWIKEYTHKKGKIVYRNEEKKEN